MSMSTAMNKKFGAMSGGEKIYFVGAFVVFLCTAGFVFPNILSSDD